MGCEDVRCWCRLGACVVIRLLALPPPRLKASPVLREEAGGLLTPTPAPELPARRDSDARGSPPPLPGLSSGTLGSWFTSSVSSSEKGRALNSDQGRLSQVTGGAYKVMPHHRFRFRASGKAERRK